MVIESTEGMKCTSLDDSETTHTMKTREFNLKYNPKSYTIHINAIFSGRDSGLTPSSVTWNLSLPLTLVDFTENNRGKEKQQETNDIDV